jgi:hypothetical protein
MLLIEVINAKIAIIDFMAFKTLINAIIKKQIFIWDMMMSYSENQRKFFRWVGIISFSIKKAISKKA